ncbi:TetR/AcrR family transcriptional regulator [Lysinibacillus sphaericus]|uniref:Transcriptional regulator n=3 Tax=Lysinibacillus TaxID=400634 RepID=W7S880_LYSSH|nr:MULTISPECIES: TetR/AcrR family transcriptional regulator [Lysinibacillus]MBE5084946.1 TetR/AcrR family transcriptional regulator [Bacillus thuringiensis]ACA38957.1 Putative HTH-type transcriptional regulator [Lysinibacillus sphaericus C3-41]AMO34810.1 transcriptional regulator [Lysinibacillus sphaericus]AMR90075.1 transcriptional regulator [Lysinibacillus sphaericus]ANA44124.1 transcriptional regulator [Lysinibacillus sphaericus]
MLKKQLIMEKALELFSEQGFEATSVQQITERCGISKGAFYLSFKTKDELVISMVDYYLQQFITDVDRVVRGTYNKETILVEFYKSIFQAFKNHSASARVFFNEKVFLTKKELFHKITAYEAEMSKSIIYMLEQLYQDKLQETKYDVMYCIKGFMKSYAELFIFSDMPLDLEQLAKSLAEKTDIIARHTTIPFITKELVTFIAKPCEQDISKEMLLQLIEQNIDNTEDSIEKESLELLKLEIEKPTYSKAIVKGLIENLRLSPAYHWIAYVCAKYLNI